MGEEETAQILEISALIRRARPVTGTSALTPNPPIPLSKSQPTDGPPKLSKHASQNPYCRILKPSSHPAILVGTVTLPSYYSNNDYFNFKIQCSCFQFTDGSATICCDILDFYPGILGKTIRICAWNFIPSKCAANIGGFLEIIRWEYLECISNSSAFSLSPGGSNIDCKDDLKAKYSIFGVFESLSPLSVVPSSAASGNSPRDLRNLCGFLSKVLVCECKLCRCKDSRTELQDLSGQKYQGHCFVKPLTLYFCGSASSWHPVVSRLIHSVVSLSGLKKKLVYIGKEDSQVMYLTTDKTSLHLPKLEKKWIPNEKVAGIRGFGKISSYAGIVTGIYMQGVVVELDEEVLLLLTDHQLLVPHSLRVGAIVSVRNVHFMNPKFSWTKGVILGACFITSIRVESFSPLEARSYIKSQSQNLLQKFIDSLTFSARLWVLLAVTCFRKKFTGIFSEKEILGSKHSEGLAQRYITSCLPSSMYQLRHGVFMEYCKHDLCNSGNGEDYGQLKLVVPISLLVSHSETSWMKMLLDLNRNFNIMDAVSQSTCISCCGRSYTKQIRRLFCSKDIGVRLLGNLKVSSSSGKLQLSDATGSIDVLMTDIPSTWDFNTIYEIEDFTVIMQGVPHKLDHLDLSLGESFTCKSIFNGAPLKKERKLSLYLHYNFRDQNPRHDMYSNSTNWKGNFQEPECGRFHLLWLEHKYPLLHELIGDEAISNRSSLFAEAILLPWDLTFAKKDEVADSSSPPTDQPRNSIKYSCRDKFEEDITIKKCKTDKTSTEAPDSGTSDTGSMIYRLSKSTTCSYSYSNEKHCDLSSRLKFPCLISSRSFKVPYQGFLHYTDGKAMTSFGCKPDGRRIFLEFGTESFYVYEGLRIGGYYVVQHNEKDMLCTIKDSSNISRSTFFITSKTCFWSLSFLADDVLKNSDSSTLFPLGGSSLYDNEVLPDFYQQHQNSHLIFNTVSPVICSDINLFIPVDIISYLKVDILVPRSGQTNTYTSFQGERDIHNGNGVFTSAPVLSSGTSHSDILLPEGDLISFQGHVLAVHDFNHDSFVAHPRNGSSCNIHEPIVSQVSGSICIHVLADHNMVRIFGAEGDYACPTGFGEGIHATFHRVLIVGEKNQYMFTPASFIVVNSANGVSHLSKEKSYSASTPALTRSVASVNASPAALSSEITKSMDVKPIQLRCRVVTLYILLLENRKAVYPSIRVQSSLPVIDIPLAGFILDDGSSSYCCWANCERAATLLRLHLEAVAGEACAGTSQRSQTTVIEKAYASTIDHLNKILRQHGRVTVKNYGSMFDSSGLDLTFSVGSEKTLSRSDEDFLRCLIGNACLSAMWSIVGSLMDATAICRLEQKLTEMGMAMLPLQHIWTAGVYHVDPLIETRERFRGFLNH